MQVREYLEKHFKETSGKDAIKLAIQAITETVEAGSKSIEMAVVEPETGLRFLEVCSLDRSCQVQSSKKDCQIPH